MSKTLISQEIKKQIQGLDRKQLADYLIKVIQELQEYQTKELTGEEKAFFESLKAEKVLLEEVNKKLTEELEQAIRENNTAGAIGQQLINDKIFLGKEKEDWKIREQKLKKDLEEEIKNADKKNAENKKIIQQLEFKEKKYSELEAEKGDLLTKNQTLEKDQRAAIQIFNRLEKELKLAEIDRKKTLEALEAVNESTEILKKQLGQEKKLRKEEEAKTAELEMQVENLINESISYKNQLETEKTKTTNYKQKQKEETKLTDLSQQYQKLWDNYQKVEQEKKAVEQQLIAERENNLNLEQTIQNRDEEIDNLELKVGNYDSLFEENKQLKSKKIKKQSTENEKEKVEILQAKIDEKVGVIESLHQNFSLTEKKWQEKLSNINNSLHQTQERLANLIIEQKGTQQELEAKTRERDEALQETQLLKDDLETNLNKIETSLENQKQEEKLANLLKTENEYRDFLDFLEGKPNSISQVIGTKEKKQEYYNLENAYSLGNKDEFLMNISHPRKKAISFHDWAIGELEKEGYSQSFLNYLRDLEARENDGGKLKVGGQIGNTNIAGFKVSLFKFPQFNLEKEKELIKNEISSSYENELNKRTTQLKEEIAAAHKKIKEVKTQRENNHQTISRHYEEKLLASKEEKDILVKKNEELSKLYEETNQKLEKLNEEMVNLKEKTEKEDETNKQNFKREHDELKEEINKLNSELKGNRSKVENLEKALENSTNEFTSQISSSEKLGNEEKTQLNQQIKNLKNEKLVDQEQFNKRIRKLEEQINNLKTTGSDEKKILENSLNDFTNKLQEKVIAENNYQEQIKHLELKINDLEQQINNLTSASDETKHSLINELTGIKQKLVQKDNKIEELENKEKELNNSISSLTHEVNSLKNTSQEEKNNLNQQIKELENAKLTSEKGLQEKINSLSDQINSLSTSTEGEKQSLRKELIFLQKRLTETEEKRDEKALSIQRLNEVVNNLQNQINSLKNTSQQEKDNLLQQLTNLQLSKETNEKNLNNQINILSQQITNLTNTSAKEKSNLNNQIADLKQELINTKKAESGYQKRVRELEGELRNTTSNLITITNNLQDVKEEKNNLLEQVRDLKESHLSAERLSQEKTRELQEQIDNLSDVSKREKEHLEEQVIDLRTKLQKKIEAEQDYQNEIKELEESLANTVKSFNERLDIALREQQLEGQSLITGLEKEIKEKEQNLEKLHNELVEIQSQLERSNSNIEQQNQELEQKNQQLTDLLEQLENKNELVENLEREIDNLQTKYVSEIDEKDKKISELYGEIDEKDQIIAELSGKPPIVISKLNDEFTDEETQLNSDSISPEFSSENLLKIIEEQEQEIQKLKSLITNESQEVVQEMTMQETIQELPKKNSTALHLSLLGGSLTIIALCLNLLKKKVQLKNKKK